MLWGFVVGAVIGALLEGAKGAVVLGLLGAGLGALIRAANRRGEAAEAPRTGKPTAEARIAALERRVAQLEARLRGSAEAVTAPAEQSSPPVASSPVAAEVPQARVAPSPGTATPATQATVAPRTPPKPPQPSFLERALQGNLVAKVGVVILFFGVGFLLKFAYDRGMFPPGLRLFTVAAAALAMGLLGWRLLARNRTYALVLVGGAMGLAYLDVFFALKTFHLIGPVAAFATFALLGIATLVLAVKLDARAVAVLGMLGAFLAPLLASTGSGQHVVLFSYYLLLNLVILAASWLRGWRELNLVGFAFTFAIGVVWGYASYRPENFATVEPFLVAFFVLYLAIPIAFAHRQPPQLRGLVDGTLVFGMPLSAALMQFALTRGMGNDVLAWSTGTAAAIYAALAAALWNRPQMRLLAQAHLALAIVFATATPYFAFAGYPTFAFWTLEGAAIFWIACRQGSVAGRVFALLLQAAAAVYFIDVARTVPGEHAVWNERVVGCALIALSAAITAFLVHRFRERLDGQARLEVPLLLWSLGWALGAIAIAVTNAWSRIEPQVLASAAALTVLLVAVEVGARWASWWAPRRLAFLHAFFLAGLTFVMASAVPESHPLRGLGALVWPASIAALAWALWRQDRDGAPGFTGVPAVVALLLAAFTVYWELDWRFEGWGLRDPWDRALVGVMAAATLATITAWRKRWPVAKHQQAFQFGAIWPLLVLLVAWNLEALGHPGDPLFWRYVPVFNPLEIAFVAGLAAAWYALGREGVPRVAAVAAMAFLLANVMVLRTVHHWDGVVYTPWAMLRSVEAQASLSLLWTATALALMFAATRRAQRGLWMAGAALLAVVVAKLFLNDLTNTGTVARIVSFIGVGLFMLAIGWVAPAPPRAAT